MLADPRPACALLVRGAAVAVASVLLGVLAHGSMAGVLPRPGSLFVIVVLVLMLVGGLLAAGQGASVDARTPPSRHTVRTTRPFAAPVVR